MGFLQNDTNSPFVDAVLTEYGRKAMARNDGSFVTVKWAASDDEVDYSLIQKFGRTLGQAKIEKNTPVFEALTNQNYALKYKVVSVSNPNLVRLPSFSLTGEGTDSSANTVSIGSTTVRRRTITVSQQIQNESSIDVELQDQSFIVELPYLFLEIIGTSPDNVDAFQRSSYILPKDSTDTALGGAKLTFTLGVKTISDAQFQVYGNKFNRNLLTTFVKVTGIQSGAVIELQVQISKTQ